MAYISPSGNIWLLSGVPLDKDYKNTLYWPLTSVGQTSQRTYFTTLKTQGGFVKHVFSNQSYTRRERGSIRVSVLADNVIDCNYMVFQNSSFGPGKYFYAFITSIEYINNATTQINFEIDVIQTWYFDFTLMPCFIERMHTDSDEIGENIVPEPVHIGEYVYPSEIGRIINTDDMVIIIAIVDTGINTAVTGNVYGRIYGAATLKAFQPTDISGINAELSSWVTAGKPDAVVAIYLAPAFLITVSVPASGGLTLTSSNVRTIPDEQAMPRLTGTERFTGYLPHNKKMYTYPYNMYEVMTASGASINLRYEFFNNLQPTFKVGGCITSPVELALIPYNYKNEVPQSATWFNTPIFSEAIKLTEFPVCSWSSDTYKAWLAQNSVPSLMNLGMAMLGAVGGAVINPVMGGLGALNVLREASSTLQQGFQASIAADNMHGNLSGSSNIAMGYQGFYGGRKCINASNAVCIDEFFDVFGYAIKSVMQPQRKNRKYFTYVKTTGCVLRELGSSYMGIPADDSEKICRLHDNGITYWDPAQTAANLIGDYSLGATNRPISEES